jgi:LmbE family N-acetylglucosaminyl deacetylase
MIKIILIALAHPDDECLFAGHIAHLSRLGHRVVLYYATQGEGGQTCGLCELKDLPDVRYLEKKEATRILGVREENIISRDFGDGTLPTKQEVLVADILGVLKEVQPDMVITFPPSGITEHPDHQTMRKVALYGVQQYEAGTGKSIELYYRVIPEGSTGIVNVVLDRELVFTYWVDVVPYWSQMYDAMMAHLTQRRAMSTIFPALARRRGLMSIIFPSLARRRDLKKLWPCEHYALIPH